MLLLQGYLLNWLHYFSEEPWPGSLQKLWVFVLIQHFWNFSEFSEIYIDL